MSFTTKTLSDAQVQVLTAGAERPDRMLLPLPATIRARGGARRNLLAALLKMDLVEEVQAADASSAWRTDEADRPIGLRLTAAGFAAIGVPTPAPAPEENNRDYQEVPEPEAEATASVEDDASQVGQGATADQDAGTNPPRRPTGKLGEVLQAMSAETGATLPELTSLTGWLPHTARAAVTGLRQRGFPISLIQHDGRKAYCLTDAG